MILGNALTTDRFISQVIVGPDGFAGLNYEHSLAEGGMLTALVDYALDYWYIS